MLPAITFIFSRAGCDGALYQCLRSRMVLTSQEEAQEIKDIVDAGVEGIPEEDLRSSTLSAGAKPCPAALPRTMQVCCPPSGTL